MPKIGTLWNIDNLLKKIEKYLTNFKIYFCKKYYDIKIIFEDHTQIVNDL